MWPERAARRGGASMARSVSGSHVSTDARGSPDPFAPPTTRTEPSPSSVAVCRERASRIAAGLGDATHRTAAWAPRTPRGQATGQGSSDRGRRSRRYGEPRPRCRSRRRPAHCRPRAGLRCGSSVPDAGRRPLRRSPMPGSQTSMVASAFGSCQPPTTSTRPSGSTVVAATSRGCAREPAREKLPDAGSQTSACVRIRSPEAPPTMSTRPSGRRDAVCPLRARARDPVRRARCVAGSQSSAVASGCDLVIIPTNDQHPAVRQQGRGVPAANRPQLPGTRERTRVPDPDLHRSESIGGPGQATDHHHPPVGQERGRVSRSEHRGATRSA